MLKIAISILSTILVAVCANGVPLSNHMAGRADLSLANYLLEHQSRSASSESMECFNIYLPLMQQLSSDWSVKYGDCLKEAEIGRNAILENASALQKDISAEAANVCNYVQACGAINDSLSALDCYGLLSFNTVSDIYVLSNNATDSAVAIREQINIIDANTYKCCNATERTFVEDSARIYDAIFYCLQNGPPATVPPPTTSTSTPAEQNEARNIQLVATPRRTPVARVLTKDPMEEEANSVSQKKLFAFVQQLVAAKRE